MAAESNVDWVEGTLFEICCFPRSTSVRAYSLPCWVVAVNCRPQSNVVPEEQPAIYKTLNIHNTRHGVLWKGELNAFSTVCGFAEMWAHSRSKFLTAFPFSLHMLKPRPEMPSSAITTFPLWAQGSQGLELQNSAATDPCLAVPFPESLAPLWPPLSFNFCCCFCKRVLLCYYTAMTDLEFTL